MDYKKHNEEVRRVWKTFEAGEPVRIPMIAGISARYFVLNPRTNPKKISFQEYTENPDLMFEMQAEFDREKRFHIMGDHIMGYPEEEGGWLVCIDFQNYFEAAWFGCEVKFPKNEVPFAVPLLDEDNREMLFEKGIPDPFEGINAVGREYYERFLERKKNYVLEGYPVKYIGTPFECTDGPFTLACELLGAGEACTLLYEEPEYMQKLLDYITESVIQRIKAWRKYLGHPEISDTFNFADDSVMLLSKEMYKEFVLPYHRKLLEGVATMKQPGMVHLCGDSTRHFKTIAQELNINAFDTGYPVKHGELVRELGSDIRIQGGPEVELLRTGTKEQIQQEAKRIIEEVKPYTKKFVLRDANNIAPYTPLENIAALYEAARLYGSFEE